MFNCDETTVMHSLKNFIALLFGLYCTTLNALKLLLKNLLLLWKTADMVNMGHCGGVHIPCFRNTEALLYQHIIWHTALKSQANHHPPI